MANKSRRRSMYLKTGEYNRKRLYLYTQGNAYVIVLVIVPKESHPVQQLIMSCQGLPAGCQRLILEPDEFPVIPTPMPSEHDHHQHQLVRVISADPISLVTCCPRDSDHVSWAWSRDDPKMLLNCDITPSSRSTSSSTKGIFARLSSPVLIATSSKRPVKALNSLFQG